MLISVLNATYVVEWLYIQIRKKVYELEKEMMIEFGKVNPVLTGGECIPAHCSCELLFRQP